MLTPLPTLSQDLERAVEVLGEPRVQVVSDIRGIDLDVSRGVYQHQAEVSADYEAPNCFRSLRFGARVGMRKAG